MKRFLILIAVIGLSASLGAQSLADLAKREKARREGLRGRHATVITNTDLLRVQKAPAVQITPPAAESGEADDSGAEDAAGEPATVTVNDEGETASLPSGSGAPPIRRIMPTVSPNGPLMTGGINRDQEGGSGTLEAQLKSATDLVDLLTTKMAALRQQYETQDAMVPGYIIQQQMDETNQKLVKAQAQQARLQALISKGGPSK